MNIDKLRRQLEIDEGVKYEVYLDHLKLKLLELGIWSWIKIQNLRWKLVIVYLRTE